MILKNERVTKILELIDTFKVCDVTHVARLFYSTNKYRIQDAQLKMTGLVKEKTLSRKRSDINSRYYYYKAGWKEPAQVQHKLLLVELYVRLCEKFGMDNVEAMPEYTGISGVRPDAFIKVKCGNRLYLYFVEVQISNNAFDMQKYEAVYRLNPFPGNVFPSVVVFTDRKLNLVSKHFNVIVVDTKFNRIFEKMKIA